MIDPLQCPAHQTCDHTKLCLRNTDPLLRIITRRHNSLFYHQYLLIDHRLQPLMRRKRSCSGVLYAIPVAGSGINIRMKLCIQRIMGHKAQKITDSDLQSLLVGKLQKFIQKYLKKPVDLRGMKSASQIHLTMHQLHKRIKEKQIRSLAAQPEHLRMLCHNLIQLSLCLLQCFLSKYLMCCKCRHIPSILSGTAYAAGSLCFSVIPRICKRRHILHATDISPSPITHKSIVLPNSN